jgi:hypothetical protein
VKTWAGAPVPSPETTRPKSHGTRFSSSAPRYSAPVSGAAALKAADAEQGPQAAHDVENSLGQSDLTLIRRPHQRPPNRCGSPPGQRLNTHEAHLPLRPGFYARPVARPPTGLVLWLGFPCAGRAFPTLVCRVVTVGSTLTAGLGHRVVTGQPSMTGGRDGVVDRGARDAPQCITSRHPERPAGIHLTGGSSPSRRDSPARLNVRSKPSSHLDGSKLRESGLPWR